MDTSNSAIGDFYIPDMIDDSVSQLRFFPNMQTNILASGGWDCKVRLWSINYQAQPGTFGANPTVQFNSSLSYMDQLDNPVLSVAWQGQTPILFAGCTDGSIVQIDPQKKAKNILGKHAAGCKDMIFNQQMNILITGGWDGKLNIWDLRSNSPVMFYQFNHKVYTMSNVNNLLVVGLSDRQMAYFNLMKLQMRQFAPEANFESHLKFQTRRVCCFTEGDGYAIGSIEGRVAVKYINLNMPPQINKDTKSTFTRNDFAFRCHRVKNPTSNIDEVYPVNDIAFNPVHGTFATAGGDGSYIIWDKDSQARLKQGTMQDKCPLTALDYSRNGDLLAYAAGYDWAKGISGDNQFRPKIGIHYLPDAEKQKKKK